MAEDQTPVEEDQNPDLVDQPPKAEADGGKDKVAYESFRKVLGEKKAMQKKLDEFMEAQKAKEDAELAEQGEFKKLLEQKEQELAELKPAKEKADKYDAYFKARLEEAKDGLTEIQVKAVEGFSGSLSDKLAMAEEFKGSTPNKTSSPGAERPGSHASAKFNLDDYLGPEGAKKLMKLSFENKELWQEVIRAKKARA